MTNAAHKKNTLVILGLSADTAKQAAEKINKITKKMFLSEKNTCVQGDIVVARLETKEAATALASRLSEETVQGKRLISLTYDRYSGLAELGEKGIAALSANKPVVKKITNREEIAKWRKGIEGEQFVVYNEDRLTNYQLSKMFPCKATKTQIVKGAKVCAVGEYVCVQRQKNLYVYGGELEMLDGFAEEQMETYFVQGDYICICTKMDNLFSRWDIYNLYSKEHIKSIGVPEGVNIQLSSRGTHYLIQLEKIVEIKSISTGLGVYTEYSQVEKNEKVEGFMSPYDNVLVVAKTMATGIIVFLYNLDTGELVRKRMLMNVGRVSIEFKQGEVYIVSVSKEKNNENYYINIWEIDGTGVITHTLDRNIKKVYLSYHVVITCTATSAKMYRRFKGQLVVSETFKGVFDQIVPGRVSVLGKEDGLLFVDEQGKVLKEYKTGDVDRVEWSQFGMYLALVDPGQVKILDLCGKEVFVTKISNNGFYWRHLLTYPAKEALKKEDLDRYKNEDKTKKTKAKTQKHEEIKELANEWRSFLIRMKSFYTSTHTEDLQKNPASTKTVETS